MKIISWNVNGIRAVEKKGELQSFLQQENPDILFLQETKANIVQLSKFLTENPEYHQFYHSAEKAGYSGVSAWVKKSVFPNTPDILTGMPGWTDSEGRVIGIETDSIIAFGVYFPNGGKSDEAWKEKLVFYDHFLEYMNKLRAKNKKIIWCGDLNVAHNEIDLARPKENEGAIGFRPEERAWVSRVVSADWVDTFRSLHPDAKSYTWWHMISRARERNVGWRIDYFFVDKKDSHSIKSSVHLNDQMGSDHCPIVLEMQL